MKVASTRSSGFAAVISVVTGAAVAVAALTGAGFVPSRTASAQVAGSGAGRVASEALQLPPVTSDQQKAEGIRQPSGLDVAEEQAGGTRTPTAIKPPAPKPVRVRSVQPAAAPAAAPAGDGWKSARVSWYGPGFYGHGMAGGGTLQPDSMVVAHRSLPFGTQIEFSYNGRTCIAVVMDRGPFSGGRVFDLGPGTASALGFSGVGTVQYRIISQ